MLKKQYKIISISSLVIILLFLVFSQTQKNVLSPKSVIAEKNEFAIKQIYITLIVDEKTFHFALNAGQSLYDTLLSAKENKQIVFSGKNYPGLGFFVTDIGSLHNGNGKYLFYYINNKEASVGVSSFLPQNGDVILWKLK